MPFFYSAGYHNTPSSEHRAMEVVRSQKINFGQNIVHLMKPNGAEMANFYAQTAN